MIPACLAIGGSDSCAGAGIQADLRVFNSFGTKGCSAIAALTAQTPEAVTRIEPVSLEQLEAEIRASFAYYEISVVKTGMLLDARRIELIASLLEELHKGKPLIIDPVMIASSGERLLDEQALDALKSRLFPLATLVTPNIPEAEALLGHKITDKRKDLRRLANIVQSSVLLKGGHGEGELLSDTLFSDGKISIYEHVKRPWTHEQAHGTGCKLASAIAAGVAFGKTLQHATQEAVEWLQKR